MDNLAQYCFRLLVMTTFMTSMVEPQKQKPILRVTFYARPGLKGIGSTLTVKRCENLPDEFNDKVSSVQTNDCVMLFADYCCQGIGRQVSGMEDFSKSSFDKTISSVSPCGHYEVPSPKEIIETWDGHNEIMNQVVEYTDISVYHNEHVLQGSGMWEQADFIGQVWRYTKDLYGNFGPEGGPLFAFFHAKSHRQFGSTTRNFFDRDSKCRNIIDMSSQGPSAWSGTLSDDERDEIVKAVARLVEWSAKGVYFNPSWGENVLGWSTWPWTEIFVFDVYNGLEMNTDTGRVYHMFWNISHENPKSRTFWFRNWFYPIYDKYGGSRVLNNYFETLARHFPRSTYELEWKYDRGMNLGEFVHFFSGAAGMDLREQAQIAFDWGTKYENEFMQAQRDFPRVRYRN